MPTIALRCLVLGQHRVRQKSVARERILWMSKVFNSLSVSENRGGHLRNPLPVDGQQPRISFLV